MPLGCADNDGVCEGAEERLGSPLDGGIIDWSLGIALGLGLGTTLGDVLDFSDGTVLGWSFGTALDWPPGAGDLDGWLLGTGDELGLRLLGSIQ